MSSAKNPVLVAVADKLNGLGISFAFIHESAIMAWGMDNNVFLDAVDVLVFDDASFNAFRCDVPDALGRFADTSLNGVPARLWSRKSLGLENGFDVTQAGDYGCECLAPETVLAKLPYSPDVRLLNEQRAKLAATVNSDTLTNSELELYASLVRGA